MFNETGVIDTWRQYHQNKKQINDKYLANAIEEDDDVDIEKFKEKIESLDSGAQAYVTVEWCQ